MDLLKAEISRKRALTESLKKHAETTENTSDVTFLRQRDQCKLREQQLLEQQKQRDGARKKAKTETQSSTPDAATSSTESDKPPSQDEQLQEPPSSLPVSSTSSIESARSSRIPPSTDNVPNLGDEKSVKSRLRELGQPVTLFGEGKQTRANRLADLLQLPLSTQSFVPRTLSVPSSSAREEAESSDGEDDGVAAVAGKAKTRGFDPSIRYSAMPNITPEQIIRKFFKAVLQQWEIDLQRREEHEKRVAKGKLETRSLKQCKEYIRPLMRMCKQRTVPPDILYKLNLMVKYCEEGNFVAANDEYIKTAIGNSAWPIGLTMVGIHERSGRERISTSKVAHIMNNELERKYLTSVKRLMTYAQSKRTDVAPSMKVLV